MAQPTLQNDKIMLRVTEAQLKGMPAFNNEGSAYRELDDNQQVTVMAQPKLTGDG